MFEKEVTVAVLSQQETLLGYLHSRLVQIEELNEFQGLRGITITHPLFDDSNSVLEGYDKLLIHGNKIWRPETCDGDPCLYVIQGKKTYNFKDNSVSVYAEEVASELSQYKILRSSGFSWTVNSSWVTNYVSELFTAGTLTGPNDATTYSGALTPMAIIRLIESNTGGEFKFRYSRTSGGVINRYIDYLDQIGTTHTTPIEIGYNTDNIIIEIDESNTRIAAGPVGAPDDSLSTFHKSMKAFSDQAFDTSTQIPLYVTSDDNGDPLDGPLAYPPYNKAAGSRYVVTEDSTELVASYQTVQAKEGGATTYPRIYTFETSEENKYNIYWDCVRNIREHMKPEISIECNVADLKKLSGVTGENYNVGDTVYLRIPTVDHVVEARVISTTKNPRTPESDRVEIGTYKVDFMAEFFQPRLKPLGDIDLSNSVSPGS